MEASSTYRMFLEDGIKLGRLMAAREILIYLRNRRLRMGSSCEEQIINSVNDLDLLRQATNMLVDGYSWKEVMDFLKS